MAPFPTTAPIPLPDYLPRQPENINLFALRGPFVWGILERNALSASTYATFQKSVETRPQLFLQTQFWRQD